MQIRLLILILCMGIGSATHAKSLLGFNFKTDLTKFSTTITNKAMMPKLVYSNGAYHSITANEFPFYRPHTYSKMSLGYNSNQPLLGSLWLNSVAESKFYAGLWNPQSKWASPNFNNFGINSSSATVKACKECFKLPILEVKYSLISTK